VCTCSRSTGDRPPVWLVGDEQSQAPPAEERWLVRILQAIGWILAGTVSLIVAIVLLESLGLRS